MYRGSYALPQTLQGLIHIAVAFAPKMGIASKKERRDPECQVREPVERFANLVRRRQVAEGKVADSRQQEVGGGDAGVGRNLERLRRTSEF